MNAGQRQVALKLGPGGPAGMRGAGREESKDEEGETEQTNVGRGSEAKVVMRRCNGFGRAESKSKAMMVPIRVLGYQSGRRLNEERQV